MKSRIMSSPLFVFLAFLGAGFVVQGLAQETVFSGPQVGEQTTPFKVVPLTGQPTGTELDLVTENNGTSTTFVFLHGIERSMAPLMRVIDEYAKTRQNSLKSEFVFLSNDRLAAEKRFPAVGKSLQLQSRLTLSVDGVEGPGNYGLNKECLMTVVVAKNNQVTANFALVQPGIADAPQIIKAMAEVSGDRTPPSVAELEAKRLAQNPNARNRAGHNMDPMPPNTSGINWDKMVSQLNNDAALREAVRSLIGEVQSLRKEVNELRSKPNTNTQTAVRREPASESTPKEEFPGAPPTDAKLLSLLRQFIQPTNDDAAVDKVLLEVNDYIKGNRDLTRQAIDGWTRVLHFGERYGTAYARTAGQTFLERLKQ